MAVIKKLKHIQNGQEATVLIDKDEANGGKTLVELTDGTQKHYSKSTLQRWWKVEELIPVAEESEVVEEENVNDRFVQVQESNVTDGEPIPQPVEFDLTDTGKAVSVNGAKFIRMAEDVPCQIKNVRYRFHIDKDGKRLATMLAGSRVGSSLYLYSRQLGEFEKTLNSEQIVEVTKKRVSKCDRRIFLEKLSDEQMSNLLDILVFDALGVQTESNNEEQ